jgi:hypothetical protein
MAKTKQKAPSTDTPLTTPTNTPERPVNDNSFAVLQIESDKDEEKSIETIDAEEHQHELESDHSNEQDNVESITAREPSPKRQQPNAFATTPEELKQTSGTGPIAEILPTDLERMKESIPIFTSNLAETAGELFPESEDTQKSEQVEQLANSTGFGPKGDSARYKLW